MQELLELRYNIRAAVKPDLKGTQLEIELIFLAAGTEYELKKSGDGFKTAQKRKVETFRAAASVNRLIQLKGAIDDILSQIEEIAKK